MKDRRWQVIAIAILLTGISLALHILAPSSLHQSERQWTERVSYHQDYPAFKARIIVTNIIVALHDATGWEYKTSFFVIQFLLLVLSGPAFYYFLKSAAFTHDYSLAGMVLYYLSLPVMLANFDPVYTWSDFWTYVLLPPAFAFLIKRRPWTGAAFFLLAFVERETTVLFLPVWVLAAFYFFRNSRRWSVYASAGAIILIFLIIRYLSGSGISGQVEFRLAYNFMGIMRTKDTLFSAFTALGFLVPAALIQLRRPVAKNDEIDNFLRLGAVITIPCFFISTLFLAIARETRLFFPPYLFVIPLVLTYVKTNMARIRSIPGHLGNFRYLLLMGTCIVVSIFIPLHFYHTFEFRTWLDGNRAYLGLHLLLTFVIIFMPTRQEPLPGRSEN